jgi:type IV secretory pathway TraG/TraD family ATPase VirD4
MDKFKWPYRWPGANLLWLLKLNKSLYARALVVLYGVVAGSAVTVAALWVSSSEHHRSYAPRNMAIGCSVAVGLASVHFGYKRLRNMVEGGMRRGTTVWISPVVLLRGVTSASMLACVALVVILVLAAMFDRKMATTPLYLEGWWPALIWPAAVVFCMAYNLFSRAYVHVENWVHSKGTVLVAGEGPIEGVPEVIRGRAFWPLHAMRQALERYLKEDGVSYGEVRIHFGGLEVPEKLLGPHSAFCGATGAGKTMSIQLFLGSALFLKGKLRNRVVTHDVKGDQLHFFRHCGVPDSHLLLCDPGSNDGAAWDVAADVRDTEGARQLASMLCPEEKSSQPYFAQVAMELTAEVLRAFQKTAPRAWDLRDVVLTCRSRELLQEVLALTEEGRAAWRNHVEGNAASTAGSVLSGLANKIGRLSYTAARWSQARRRFSLREFVRHDPRVLVLRNRENRSEVAAPVFRALLRFLAEDVLSLPERHEWGETWFVLDELPSLGAFEKLDTFLSQARSKRGRVIIGFQDIDALATVWGREKANVLVGLCTNVTCLQTASPSTAAYWTKAFGRYKFPEVSITRSWGRETSNSETTANRTEEAILESEIMALPPASMKNGIVGCYMSPMLGMWRGETPPSTLRSGLPPLKEAEVEPQEDEEVELKPWDAEDRGRLGLGLAMRSNPTLEEQRPRGIPKDDGEMEQTA